MRTTHELSLDEVGEAVASWLRNAKGLEPVEGSFRINILPGGDVGDPREPFGPSTTFEIQSDGPIKTR